VEQPILSDKNQFPSQDIIFSHIGKTKTLWLSLFENIHTMYPDFVEEWRYYNDGKSWLLKVTRKKKTIFWLSIIKDAFRTTFYFGDKAEEMIMASEISDSLKEQFKNGKRYGRIRGLTIAYAKVTDIKDAMALMEIKILMK
jgi:hypothetical protein